jgi:exodeoxyribonuclease V alpha subunit
LVRRGNQIAAKLDIEKTALIRVRAGISFALAEAMDDGHCGLPHEKLLALTRQLLEVLAELVETALGLELQDGTVIADDLDGRRCVFLAGLYRAEREIAEKLNALAAGKPPWPLIDADKAIPWVEKRTKLALAESQIEAVRVALASKVLVITGGPGVGKTTLVNSILKILLAKTVDIALCAPTGRAAKRLSESTGLEAKTIHRLLETDARTGAFRRTEEASSSTRPATSSLRLISESTERLNNSAGIASSHFSLILRASRGHSCTSVALSRNRRRYSLRQPGGVLSDLPPDGPGWGYLETGD